MNKSRGSQRRVLILTTAYEPLIGGSEIAIREVTKRLNDVFFDIVTPRYSAQHLRLEQQGNVSIHRVGRKWLFPVLGYFKSRSLLNRYFYEAIHLWQASFAGGVAWLLRLLGVKIPIILTLQEGKDLYLQGGIKKYLRKTIINSADQITAISSYLASYAREVWNGGENISVIPNGVDLEKFVPASSTTQDNDLRLKLMIPKGKRIIFSSSRLVYKNGIDDLIHALLDRRLQDVYLVIAGDGPDRKKLENIVQNLGLKKRVNFLGLIPHDHLPQYLRVADVFIRPSRTEGLGISFLEAMAVGTPVVATPVGGIPDFLKEYETGVFCEPNNPESIAKATNAIFSDYQLRENIITNARSMVVKQYDWDNIAMKYREVYDVCRT